ncbi:MAG: hypothetical protein V7K88_21785 [Nostoc sp.]
MIFGDACAGLRLRIVIEVRKFERCDAYGGLRLRIIPYAHHLKPGVYSLHYLVRSITLGTFSWSGAQVHLQYAPEEFGRTGESTLILKRDK